jgi:transcriptional regulator with XRE-family HTH domain
VPVPQVIRQLSALRRKAGLTQAELAERVGTVQSAISEMEAGLVSPNLATLTKCAEVFGMEIVLTVSEERP